MNWREKAYRLAIIERDKTENPELDMIYSNLIVGLIKAERLESNKAATRIIREWSKDYSGL